MNCEKKEKNTIKYTHVCLDIDFIPVIFLKTVKKEPNESFDYDRIMSYCKNYKDIQAVKRQGHDNQYPPII